MKKTMYVIAVILSVILLFGTAGASDQGKLTGFETLWQAAVSVFSAIWWANLVRIENERERRKIHED